ncbi:hypothetical protein MXAN_1550 [Myxococcus xanthus DK 1622]|uniref:DUF4340 domain-containing protein n=1 Tax=Myxococcus xanthus (strain DK1622) TaxID=246197 RepID=Q1DC21_MYXXD|nr:MULTISPECIES: hypothetical protein [Myxococcus]ABF90184.1 hypothetical protein MXAN_1550 [Myxococcus xanthus DK 1622]NOJ51868.1 hypothetical protein [Myxococcus xanthus]QPM81180.1 hypothetical protein I5Q59_07735 [Myxococcus xanthus]QVW70239.1 hypothetical protein JTM82_12025 [Myxococcus xanthus DZ2]QZZ49076.1 hypothetical protein MyxoNM_07690 [Myxococcus xanthus]
MKVRDLALQGALAAAALIAAFVVWQREPSAGPGEVTVVDVPARALDSIRYEDDSRFVDVFRDASERDRLWVRLGYKASRAASGGANAGATDAGVAPQAADAGGATAAVGTDAGTGAAAGQPPVAAREEPPPPRELRANEVADKLFSRFAPMRAMRALGELDAKKQEEVGLATSPRKLTLTVAGKARVFALASPPGGWGTPYLRSEEDGRVYLLGPAMLPDLENANSRLVDRRLHTFDLGDFDAVTIRAGGATRAFQATGKAPGPVVLAPEDAPERPDDFARNWHDRVWRMMPVDLLGRDEPLPGGEPQESFRVDYLRAGRAVGHVMVVKGEGGFYARTEHTTGWARLHSGMDALAEEAVRVTAPVSTASGK